MVFSRGLRLRFRAHTFACGLSSQNGNPAIHRQYDGVAAADLQLYGHWLLSIEGSCCSTLAMSCHEKIMNKKHVEED